MVCLFSGHVFCDYHGDVNNGSGFAAIVNRLEALEKRDNVLAEERALWKQQMDTMQRTLDQVLVENTQLKDTVETLTDRINALENDRNELRNKLETTSPSAEHDDGPAASSQDSEGEPGIQDDGVSMETSTRDTADQTTDPQVKGKGIGYYIVTPMISRASHF